MELIETFRTPEAAVAGVKRKLARKEKVMGFGHAVYKQRDPRNAMSKRVVEAARKNRRATAQLVRRLRSASSS